MKFEDFTIPQQRAIIEQGNIIVSAGAGSGKTAVLTERVKYFVKNHGYNLDEFLILTFTNAAAAEMKERIRKALTEEGLDAKDYVDTADICTFDSYSLALVKKYHFMLKVSPDLSIVDGNIISVRKQTIVEDIFEEMYKKEDTEFLNMIDRYAFKDDKDLQSLALKIYKRACLSLDKDAYLNNYIETFYNDDLINEMQEFVTEHIKGYIPLIMDAYKYGVQDSLKSGKPYRDEVMELLRGFLEGESYDKMISTILNTKIPKIPSGLDEETKKLNGKFRKPIDDAKDYCKKLPATTEDFKKYVTDNIPYTKVLLEIVKELDKKIMEYKNKYQVFEFGDISKLALDLVKSNEEVRNSIKNKLKMIMIDEYQDTSALQETFVNLIANNNVYMVGDVKQSIYGFRDANCDIFIDKYDRYKKGDGGVAIDLNTNFRSRKEVLSDINYIFKNLMTKEYGGADYKKDHMIEFGNTRKYLGKGETHINNHSTFIFHDKNGLDIPKEEANIICRDIIDKINNKYQVCGDDGLRDCKFSDFCIIMDRGGEFENYYKIFNEYQIPLHVEKDEDIKENEIVLIVKNLLKLMRAINNNNFDKEFKKAFISVARSYLYNYTDEELYQISKANRYKNDKIVKDISQILFEYKTYPLAKQFEKVIFKLDIYNKLINSGEVTKNEQYLDLIIKMFNDMTKLDYSLEDFIIYLDNINTYDIKINLPSTGSTLDSVNIINIHKSKGLEYPIIYFSGLNKKFNLSDITDNFNTSKRYGLYYAVEDSKKEVDVVKLANDQLVRKETISEKIRLFYVALTRTQEKMIFVVKDDEKAHEIKDNLDNDIKLAFSSTHDLKDKSPLEVATLAVDAYLDGLINKEVFMSLLEEYHVPLPERYVKFSDDDFVVDRDELLSISQDIEDMLSKLESRMLDRKEVVIYLYSLLNSGEATDTELEYCLNKYNYKLINIDDYIDEDGVEPGSVELTRDDIVSKDKDEENDSKPYYKNETLINERIYDYKEESIEKEDLINLINFVGLKYDDSKIDRVYLSTLPKDNLYEEVIINKELVENDGKDLDFVEGKLYELKGNDFAYYNYLINKNYINQKYISDIIDYISNNKSLEFRLDLYKILVKILGYDITNKTEEYLTTIYNEHISERAIEEYKVLPFVEKYIAVDNISNYRAMSLQTIFYKLFLECKSGNITKDDFNYLLDIFNYELDIDFLKIKDEDMDKIKEIDILDILSPKRVVISDPFGFMRFNDCILPFINNIVFPFNVYDTRRPKEKLNNISKEVEEENLDVCDIEVKIEPKTIFKASKDLDLSASKKNMEFGTHLHFIMETIDFYNPDTSKLDEKAQKIVDKFLNSSLMKNVKEASIYKEYEFLDESSSTNGIIDLMLVYPDHIDIIDYKTKNIDDESYDKQLKIYKDFAKCKFNKPVNTYLYALLTGEIRKCN